MIKEKEIKQISFLDVVISEISWMGTSASYNDEWIELFNNTANPIDLDGWAISWSHGTTSRVFVISTVTGNTIIPAEGFYLLERTDSSTTDILEDQIYTGALNNSGEKLELRDNNNILIDETDCSLDWFAGRAAPDYVSMERINSKDPGNKPENWSDNNQIIINGLDADQNPIQGTPKAKNSGS